MGALESEVSTTGTGYFQRPQYPTFYSHSTEGFLVKNTTEDGIIGWGEAQAPLVRGPGDHCAAALQTVLPGA